MKKVLCLAFVLAMILSLAACGDPVSDSENSPEPAKSTEKAAVEDIRVTFVGASHGVPEAGRKCSCTMIEIGENTYFVDMGANASETLATRGIPFESVKGIFITHMHGDHTDGLINFVDLASWCYTSCSPKILLPEIGGVEPIREWLACTDVALREDLVFEEVKEGKIYDDGLLTVTAIPNSHCENSYCLLLEAKGKKLLFTGDLESPSTDLPSIVNETEIDLLVCEGAHFSPISYKTPLSSSLVKKVVVNHYTPEHYSDIFALGKALKTVPVFAATDGYEVSVG